MLTSIKHAKHKTVFFFFCFIIMLITACFDKLQYFIYHQTYLHISL